MRESCTADARTPKSTAGDAHTERPPVCASVQSAAAAQSVRLCVRSARAEIRSLRQSFRSCRSLAGLCAALALATPIESCVPPMRQPCSWRILGLELARWIVSFACSECSSQAATDARLERVWVWPSTPPSGRQSNHSELAPLAVFVYAIVVCGLQSNKSHFARCQQ